MTENPKLTDTLICELCQKLKVNNFCHQCNQIICLDCSHIHKRSKASESHKVSHLFGKDAVFIDKCQMHKEALCFYCSSCSTDFCHTCARNHLINYKHNVSLSKTFVVKLNMDNSYAKDKIISPKELSELESSFKKFDFDANLIMKKITGESNTLTVMIKKEELNLKAEINKQIELNFKHLENVKLANRKLDEVKHYSDHLLSFGHGDHEYSDTYKIDILINKLNELFKHGPDLKDLMPKASEFPYQRLKYQPVERSECFLGKLSNEMMGCLDTPRKPSAIAGIRNNQGHGIFVYQGDVNDVTSDVCMKLVDGRFPPTLPQSRAGRDGNLELLQSPNAANGCVTTAEAAQGAGYKHMVYGLLSNGALKPEVCRVVELMLRRSKELVGKSDAATVVISMSLDDFSIFDSSSEWFASIVFEATVAYLEGVAAENSSAVAVEVNFLGKDQMMLAILTSTMESFLEESKKEKQSLITTFPSGFCLEVCTGSILDAKVDAILIAVNNKLILNHGKLSGRLLDIAGYGIQHECYKKKPYSFDHGDVIYTRGYGLKCRTVFHGCIEQSTSTTPERTSSQVKSIISKAMKMCGSMNISNLALPALGTGTGFDSRMSAAVILEQIHNFAEQHLSNQPLKKITIFLHPSDKTTKEAFFSHVKALYPRLKAQFWTLAVNRDAGENKSNLGSIDGTGGKDAGEVDIKSLSLKEGRPSDGNPAEESPPKILRDMIWETEEESGVWIDYPSKINKMLEQHFLDGTEMCIWKENDQLYRVTYSEMVEEEKGSKKRVRVRRREV